MAKIKYRSDLLEKLQNNSLGRKKKERQKRRLADSRKLIDQ